MCASWNLAGRNCISVNITRGSAVFWLLTCLRNLLGLIIHNQWNTNGLLGFQFLGRLDILYLWSHPAFSTQWKQNKCSVHTTITTWQDNASTNYPIRYSDITNPHACWRQKDCILQALLNPEVTGVWENFPARSFFMKLHWQFFSYFLIFLKKPMFYTLSNCLWLPHPPFFRAQKSRLWVFLL